MRAFVRLLWKLRVGILLGLILLGTGIYIGRVSDAGRQVPSQLAPHDVQEQRFVKVMALFAQAGATFRAQHAAARFDFPALLTQLNATRRELATLQTASLTPPEQERLARLTAEEQRFRTALHGLAAALAEESSHHKAAFSATMIDEINQVLARVTNQGQP